MLAASPSRGEASHRLAAYVPSHGLGMSKGDGLGMGKGDGLGMSKDIRAYSTIAS